ncbi:MAG: helix-turn-helix domain-containing protein [Sedimentisphaerales bacterium]|nr:helix-turn-helix domain-containing protein [Sedimentisphaerales bacterium]
MRIENTQSKHGTTNQGHSFVKEQLLTPHEVALRLRVTSEQIRSLIRRGQLAAVNVGAGKKRPLYRVTPAALDTFLEKRCQCSKAHSNKEFRRLAPAPDFFPDLK